MTRCKNCKWMHGNNPRYRWFYDADCSHPVNVVFLPLLASQNNRDKDEDLFAIRFAAEINDGNCRYYEPTLLGRVKGWLGR